MGGGDAAGTGPDPGRGESVEMDATYRLRVHVDHELCVGFGMCVATVPGVFVHNENRQSEVRDGKGGTEAQILEAAANCPTGAIQVTKAPARSDEA